METSTVQQQELFPLPARPTREWQLTPEEIANGRQGIKAARAALHEALDRAGYSTFT